ncbi:MAG: hypothetical protein LH609_14800 [Rudanella sp.]|nr:hypothetical protein [Rudanella sp.]
MTPEKRAYFARVTAANAEAVKAEKRKIQKAVERKETETVKNLLDLGILTTSQIAKTVGVSEDFVLKIAGDK